jgi:hypothetical protein
MKAIASARIKNDKIDAKVLAHLLRADLVAESYVPPRGLRDVRALVRHSALPISTFCASHENAVRKDFTVSEMVAIKRAIEPEVKETVNPQGRPEKGANLAPLTRARRSRSRLCHGG